MKGSCRRGLKAVSPDSRGALIPQGWRNRGGGRFTREEAHTANTDGSEPLLGKPAYNIRRIEHLGMRTRGFTTGKTGGKQPGRFGIISGCWQKAGKKSMMRGIGKIAG